VIKFIKGVTMDNLNFINGATVSATDVRKSWTKIVKGVKESKRPVFVFTNNVPEAVVLDFEEYQAIEKELEAARREELGRQMLADLLEISELENKPITPLMVAEFDTPYDTAGKK